MTVFRTNKHLLESLKKVVLEVLISEIFILVLMINFMKIVGKNLKNQKILTRNTIAVIIMMRLSINMV